MSFIPQPYAEGQPYVLKIGDRINYFLRFHAIQVYSDRGGPEVEFLIAPNTLVPRFVLPRDVGRQDICALLNDLASEQGISARIEQVESSIPSVETFEVKALP